MDTCENLGGKEKRRCMICLKPRIVLPADGNKSGDQHLCCADIVQNVKKVKVKMSNMNFRHYSNKDEDLYENQVVLNPFPGKSGTHF